MRQKPQWPTDPTKKKYSNKNYCWLNGYDTSDPHTSEKYTKTNVGNMKEATQGKPMGVSQNNKACLWKK